MCKGQELELIYPGSLLSSVFPTREGGGGRLPNPHKTAYVAQGQLTDNCDDQPKRPHTADKKLIR